MGYIHGMENLTRLVLNTLTAFPDIKLHIVDTFCTGNDIDGYKTTMPVIHTATHLGPHPVFGKPTGKKLTWYGLPNSFIKNIDGQWKYISEINIPDSLSLFSQLGVDPPRQTWNIPTKDCQQLFDWETGHINSDLRPSLKGSVEEVKSISTRKTCGDCRGVSSLPDLRHRTCCCGKSLVWSVGKFRRWCCKNWVYPRSMDWYDEICSIRRGKIEVAGVQ